jgi:C4-dicarboxylate transporter, DctQ subunit
MMRMWNRVEQAIVGVLGLAALAIALWQVLSRYAFPRQSIGYAEEVMVYLLIWATMIVSSQLVRTDSHIRPDLVRNILPAGMARWLEMINCVAAVVFCAALIWYGWEIVGTARIIDEHSSSDLRFPMWVYYAALPAGGALMLTRFVIRLVAIARVPGGDPLPGQQHGSHELAGMD